MCDYSFSKRFALFLPLPPKYISMCKYVPKKCIIQEGHLLLDSTPPRKHRTVAPVSGLHRQRNFQKGKRTVTGGTHFTGQTRDCTQNGPPRGPPDALGRCSFPVGLGVMGSFCVEEFRSELLLWPCESPETDHPHVREEQVRPRASTRHRQQPLCPVRWCHKDARDPPTPASGSVAAGHSKA